jgi:hypothetical protein
MNLDDIRERIEKSKIDVALANQRIAELSSLAIVANIKKRFRPRESGDMVISKRTGNPWYRSTPPFQPVPPDPTSRSGTLVSHIDFEVIQVGESAAAATIGPTIIHGKYVEQGSHPPGTGQPSAGVGRGNNRRPFPYLANGLKDSETEIIDIYREQWLEALDG